MTAVTVRVPAKVNLQLAVGPVRPDGFHELVTVFHAISLYDEVTVSEPAGAGSRSPERARPPFPTVTAIWPCRP